MTGRNDECLICGKQLEYLAGEVEMTCHICGKKIMSNTRCIDGHYVCDECHTKGIDNIMGICLGEKGTDPYKIILEMMDLPSCHMHGPEHHIMVGCALLTAYKNAGGHIDLENALIEMIARGKKVPGGVCGNWGSCGAAISSGMFMSIITGATPLTNESWGLSNLMTSKSLYDIGTIGGPRCCKRNSFTAITAAVEFCRERLGVQMECGKIICSHSEKNNQCIKERCPFNPANN